MTQLVLEHSDKLTDYINNIEDTKSINVRLKSICPEPERSNVLITFTTLPQVLINIINAYADDLYDIRITRKIINYHEYCNINDRYVRRVHIHFNFDAHSFQSLCCIKFKYIQYSSVVYKSLLNTLIKDNNVIEYKLFEYTRRFQYYEELFRRQQFLKQLFKESDYWTDQNKNVVVCNNLNKYCHDCNKNDYDNDNINFDLMNAFDSNLFFNCFSNNTQQKHNIIKHDTPRIRRKDGVTYIVENCEYNKKTNKYEHILVNEKVTKMAQYEIKNYDQFTNILIINKILYEFVNKQMKNMSNDYDKIQRLYKVYKCDDDYADI